MFMLTDLLLSYYPARAAQAGKVIVLVPIGICIYICGPIFKKSYLELQWPGGFGTAKTILLLRQLKRNIFGRKLAM